LSAVFVSIEQEEKRRREKRREEEKKDERLMGCQVSVLLVILCDARRDAHKMKIDAAAAAAGNASLFLY